MRIAPDQLRPQLASQTPPLVLDVRSPAEFREMAIAGSVSMPLDELDPAKVKALSEGHGRCVVVCYSGKRSDQACNKLQEAGLADVASLDGGLELWQRKQLPLERSSGGTFSIIRQVQIIVGLMVLLGAVLALTLNPWWAILSGFFGAGLAFAGLTGFCGLALVLARMPWNRV